MDLLDQNRSLVHAGKLLRQPDSGLEWNGWTELHVLLFDNYCTGAFFARTSDDSDSLHCSGYDETQGKGRSTEIPSSSPSKHLPYV